MGLLDKILRGANRADQAVADAGQAVRDATLNRPYVRGERMMREGDTAVGRIVGYRRSLDDSTTRHEITVAYEADGKVTRAGMQVRAPGARHLRLGQDVPLRLDAKGRAVIDGPRFDARFDLTSTILWAEPSRKVVDDGLVDTAVDGRFSRRLKKGTPSQGTITSVDWRFVFGSRSENADVQLRLDDGRVVTDGGQEIPFYAGWLATAGERVPIALDPGDATKATVDWAAAARAAADRAGSWDDPA